ncbi:MAG: EamA/RhaT family transporter [Ruminococcaceae bacterium]|nr:EamA/RhaT family transporter [Oscillospiraceae bacterium]MBR3598003.1 EamA family transporter [Clostridia bacterium]
MKRFFNARLMLILSMAIFGTIGLFRRNIDVSSGELAFYRAVLATVFIGLFLLVTKNRIPFGKIKKQLPLLIISGVAMAFNWILLFEAYNYTTVSVATLSYYFAPVIVTLLCPVLFKEKMGVKQWVCFIMSTVGIVLITGIGSLDTGSNHFLGILCGLGAACLYATVILLNKFIRDVDGIHRTFLQFVSAVVVLCPYVLFTSGINLSGLDTKGIVLLLTVGLVHTGITYCMYFSSLKELTGQKAAILSYIDPLVAVLCSVLILHETMTVTQIIGGVLILGFALWNEITPKKGGKQ